MTTTSEDVWRILAELATAQAELTAAQKETDKQLKETDLLLKEVSQQQKENAQQLKETDKQLKETDLLLKEVSQQQKENAQQQKKTDKQLKELGQQIGGLGAKFGSFTEGLALPSMETILRQRFGMEVVSPSVRVSKNGQHLEIDVLAYTNGELNTAYIVEVKSHAREESITQLKSILQRFRSFFPEHKDKKLYGILAAVHVSPELREKILQEGFYVARIHDQVFELDIPDNFQPQIY
jgi:septal ring factor EnvC (AmiA/AmiB activator)